MKIVFSSFWIDPKRGSEWYSAFVWLQALLSKHHIVLLTGFQFALKLVLPPTYLEKIDALKTADNVNILKFWETPKNL